MGIRDAIGDLGMASLVRLVIEERERLLGPGQHILFGRHWLSARVSGCHVVESSSIAKQAAS